MRGELAVDSVFATVHSRNQKVSRPRRQSLNNQITRSPLRGTSNGFVAKPPADCPATLDSQSLGLTCSANTGWEARDFSRGRMSPRRSSLRPLAARRTRVSTFAPAGASPMMPPPHSLFVATGSSSVLPAGMTRITDAEAGVWADAPQPASGRVDRSVVEAVHDPSAVHGPKPAVRPVTCTANLS